MGCRAEIRARACRTASRRATYYLSHAAPYLLHRQNLQLKHRGKKDQERGERKVAILAVLADDI